MGKGGNVEGQDNEKACQERQEKRRGAKEREGGRVGTHPGGFARSWSP